MAVRKLAFRWLPIPVTRTINLSVCCMLMCFLSAEPMKAQTYSGTYPQSEISNGILRAKIYLPDADKGFYRGTRFDWAGVIGSLEYGGHEYFGPFFEKFTPSVSDVVIGDPIEAGVNSAASGPVEEFVSAPDGSALGYDEAKAGESFCKIGVGSLRKIDDSPYSSYTNYPIVSTGKRTTKSGPDWIELTQELECGSGYSYRYQKTIRLAKGEPVMTIEHRLVNTGKRAIETQVYDHNFLTIDHQTTGPALSVSFPFSLEPMGKLEHLAEVRGNQLSFPKEFEGSDTFYAEFKGFGYDAKDYAITVEDKNTGAGVVISGDQPLAHLGLWAVRTVVAPEPYIQIKVPVARDVRWIYTYRFYQKTARK